MPIAETLDSPRTALESSPKPFRISHKLAFLCYSIALLLVSLHLYRTPGYDMDSAQYMGNALLMEETDLVRVHDRVYSELRRQTNPAVQNRFWGTEIGAPQDQNESRHRRAVDPYCFGEFLPFFAIRPLYNQALYVASKTGMGLIRSSILISSASYFLIGILLFV